MGIRIEGVKKKYGRLKEVEGMDMKIENGEFMELMGN